jgi:hypothetical protein
MRVEAKGRVGTSDNMKPQAREFKDGSIALWFRMFCDIGKRDASVPDPVLEVILPSNERGQKIFAILKANSGRKVFVRGYLTHNANSVVKDGKTINYPNPICRLEQLEFMDDAPSAVGKSVINTLVDTGALTKDMAEQCLAAWNKNLAAWSEKTAKQAETKADAAPPENTNPDDLSLI